MPTKTLYVKDQQLWEKASRLAGDQGFSEVVAQLLAKWVAAKEKQEAMKNGKEFTEMELWVGGSEHWDKHPEDPIGDAYKIAFTGRLLTGNEGWELDGEPVPSVKVYQMKSGRLLVYRDWLNTWEFEQDPEKGATYKVFSDYAELSQDFPIINSAPAVLGAFWYTAKNPDGDEYQKMEEEYNLRFQKRIADALGAEMIVRID